MIVHLTITVIFMIVGVVLVPRWYTHSQLNKLTATTLDERELGLNYIIQRAGSDPRVLQGTIDRLGVEDPINFLQIVNALDRAGKWSRPPIPDDPWLRWLKTLATDANPNSRINAAQLLEQLTDLAGNGRVVDLIETCLGDKDEQVRYQALITAARLVLDATNRATYEALFVKAAADPSQLIARQAWIMLGLLGAADDTQIDWRRQPPEVSQAALWALLKSNPNHPGPALEVLADPLADLSLRAMAAYALHLSPTANAQSALGKLATTPAHQITPENRTAVWHAILGLSDETAAQLATGDSLVTTLESHAELNAPLLEPVILARLYRGWGIDAEHIEQQLAAYLGNPQYPHPLALLAVIEGLPVGQYNIAIPSDAPDMLRLAAVAVTKDPQPSDLRPLFVSETSTLRDLACVVAAQRFSPQQHDQLVAELLNDFNDDAKRSGAILAGLTGAQRDLLAKKAHDEDIWSVQQILRLGLWMQGQHPEMKHLAPGLLTRDDLPTTTILLAMLHRGHNGAWEYLFNPRGDQPFDLVELLDQHRWWHVLAQYIPELDRDDLPFWYWGDVDLEQFQIDVLTSWYALNGPPPRPAP